MEPNMMDVIQSWRAGEIANAVKVWTTAVFSLSHCYFITKIAPKPAPRLVAFLPVVALFVFLPLNLHSTHLTGLTSFFLAWLANFKLLMLAFDKGPLCGTLSLPQFLALGCLPILTKTLENYEDHKRRHQSLWNYSIKGALYISLTMAYDYAEILHPILVKLIYGVKTYLSLEIILVVISAAAGGLLGMELEPQFDEPHLSSSLQNFWGRRWNIVVSRVLHQALYIPVRDRCSAFVGRRRASTVAVVVTFLVSGMMHELIFYCLGRVRPTWEVTWFFVVQGVSVAGEIEVKRAVKGRWELPRAVAAILTIGWVSVTGHWLFLPQLVRCEVLRRGQAEMAAVGAFVKDVFGVLLV